MTESHGPKTHKGSIGSIDLIVQSLPPAHDAIGEYTSYLACELSRSHEVRILTSRDRTVESLHGISINACFSLHGKQRFSGLLESLMNSRADAVVLQYNPFAWGDRGWAVDLASVIRRLRKKRPQLVIAVMFHELYPPATELRFRLMRLWQVPQFKSLCASADVAFFSTGLWAAEEKLRRPKTNAIHLPVGANLPNVIGDRAATRCRYGIETDALVLGVFGGAHISKQLDWVKAAVDAVTRLELGRPVTALHVGGESEEVLKQLLGVPLVQTGRLEPTDAALAIAAMDILLNPLLDGTSTRRGSTIAGLQNSVAVATTAGFNTESLWSEPAASGVVLSPVGNIDKWLHAVCTLAADSEQQRIAGKTNRKLFEKYFDWPVIAKSMISRVAIEQERKQIRTP